MAPAPAEAQDEAARLTLSVQEQLSRGDAVRAFRTAEAGLEQARSSNDGRTEATAQDLLASVHLACGRADEAAEASWAAAQLFAERGELHLAATSVHARCEAAAAALGAERCEAALQDACALRGRCRAAGDVAAEAQAALAVSLGHFGTARYEESLAAAREAADLFEAAGGQALGQARALTTMAELRLALGVGPGFARRAAQKARKLLREVGGGYERDVLRASLAECQARVAVQRELPVHVNTAAAWTESLEAAREVEELARRLGDLGSAASALCAAAQVHSATGRLQAAARAATAAADLYRENAGSAEVLRALVICIDAYTRLDRAKDARRLAAEAAELAKELGDTDTEAMARQVLAGVTVDPDGSAPSTELEPSRANATLATEEPEASMEELMIKALGMDASMPALGAAPLMQVGAPAGAFAPMGHEEFLALGRPSGQATAALALLESTAERTARCRLSRIPWEASGGAQGRRPAAAAPGAGAGEGVAWVAPVRKRMESGPHWRPPNIREGISFSAMPRRRAAAAAA